MHPIAEGRSLEERNGCNSTSPWICFILVPQLYDGESGKNCKEDPD